jgi:hypothetical protein
MHSPSNPTCCGETDCWAGAVVFVTTTELIAAGVADEAKLSRDSVSVVAPSALDFSAFSKAFTASCRSMWIKYARQQQTENEKKGIKGTSSLLATYHQLHLGLCVVHRQQAFQRES